MTKAPAQRNLWDRFVDWFGASTLGSWLYSRIGPPIDRLLLRLSKGRYSLAVAKPIALLETTGRKTGLKRTTPVLYTRDGDNIILIASNFGSPTHPAWYLNLATNPRVNLILDGTSGSYVARTAGDDERDDLWAKCLANYRGFSTYKNRARQRQIPIVVLKPISDAISSEPGT